MDFASLAENFRDPLEDAFMEIIKRLKEDVGLVTILQVYESIFLRVESITPETKLELLRLLENMTNILSP